MIARLSRKFSRKNIFVCGEKWFSILISRKPHLIIKFIWEWCCNKKNAALQLHWHLKENTQITYSKSWNLNQFSLRRREQHCALEKWKSFWSSNDDDYCKIFEKKKLLFDWIEILFLLLDWLIAKLLLRLLILNYSYLCFHFVCIWQRTDSK